MRKSCRQERVRLPGIGAKMSQSETKQEVEPIDDDTFAYEGGFSQCISGFGRNAIENIVSRFEPISDEDREAIEWHINELVRWCRHFNGKCKQLSAAQPARGNNP
jgi:hypothetical protein